MKKLKPHKVDWGQIDRFLASADKKLASAHKILAFDEEACLQQAYEAMLKASLGFMFSHGFRARSQPGHHIAIIDFVRASTRNMLASSWCSTASEERETWLYTTSPGSSRIMTLSKLSKLPKPFSYLVTRSGRSR